MLVHLPLQVPRIELSNTKLPWPASRASPEVEQYNAERDTKLELQALRLANAFSELSRGVKIASEERTQCLEHVVAAVVDAIYNLLLLFAYGLVLDETKRLPVLPREGKRRLIRTPTILGDDRNTY